MNEILVLGGYGNFGKMISERLVKAGIYSSEMKLPEFERR